MKLTILVWVIFLLCCSCRGDEFDCKNGPVTPFFINSYFYPSHLSLFFQEDSSKEYRGYFSFLYGGGLHLRPKKLDLTTSSESISEFTQIARRNKDTTYYKPICEASPTSCLGGQHIQFNFWIVNTDYNDHFTKGSSLNSIMDIQFTSAQAYLDKNYTGTPFQTDTLNLTEFNNTNRYAIAHAPLDDAPLEFLRFHLKEFPTSQDTLQIAFTFYCDHVLVDSINRRFLFTVKGVESFALKKAN